LEIEKPQRKGSGEFTLKRHLAADLRKLTLILINKNNIHPLHTNDEAPFLSFGGFAFNSAKICADLRPDCRFRFKGGP